MSYCECHDDYVNSGTFDLSNVRVYRAFQVFHEGGKQPMPGQDSSTPIMDRFTTFYADGQASGAYPAIGAAVVTLPADPPEEGICANYDEDEAGVLSLSDYRIFRAFQVFHEGGRQPMPGQDSSTSIMDRFLAFYADGQASGAYPAIGADVKHLPILEADTQVITDGGLVDKCDTSALCTCSAVVEGDVLKVDFDATTLSETPLVGSAIDGRIKGVEIVFDNVSFTSSNGLSVTPETSVTDGFTDTQNLATLNFYYDYSIRSTSVNDEATEPNKTKSVIGFIDTTQDGTGKTKAEVGALTFSVDSDNFSITSGDTPTISDVRVYDSSAEVAQYNITRCGE